PEHTIGNSGNHPKLPHAPRSQSDNLLHSQPPRRFPILVRASYSVSNLIISLHLFIGKCGHYRKIPSQPLDPQLTTSCFRYSLSLHSILRLNTCAPSHLYIPYPRCPRHPRLKPFFPLRELRKQWKPPQTPSRPRSQSENLKT